MAAVALNTFKTIRAGITTEMVGIYTCPIGVASIITLALATNVSTGSTVHTVTVIHSRVNPLNPSDQTDYRVAYNASIPPNDSLNIIADGRLVLETNDILKIQADANGELEFILSVLENAKQ
jgi:hypothetical protein